MTENQKKMRNIKPGEFYIDYGNRLCCCIKNDYENDDLFGIPIFSKNKFSSCSFVHCGPEYIDPWELPFLTAILKENNEALIMSTSQMMWCFSHTNHETWEDYSIEIFDAWVCNAEHQIEIISNTFTVFNKKTKIRKYDPNAKKYLSILFKYYDIINLIYNKIKKS